MLIIMKHVSFLTGLFCKSCKEILLTNQRSCFLIPFISCGMSLNVHVNHVCYECTRVCYRDYACMTVCCCCMESLHLQFFLFVFLCYFVLDVCCVTGCFKHRVACSAATVIPCVTVYTRTHTQCILPRMEHKSVLVESTMLHVEHTNRSFMCLVKIASTRFQSVVI